MVALDSNKFMPVHWAAWEGHTEVAEALATNMPLAVLTTAKQVPPGVLSPQTAGFSVPPNALVALPCLVRHVTLYLPENAVQLLPHLHASALCRRHALGVRCAVCGVRCAVCGARCAVCGVRCST